VGIYRLILSIRCEIKEKQFEIILSVCVNTCVGRIHRLVGANSLRHLSDMYTQNIKKSILEFDHWAWDLLSKDSKDQEGQTGTSQVRRIQRVFI
jgi:hypothetical protein